MVWVIVVVAVLVLGLAAWVGTGRLGEMPEVVGDRPKGRIPEGPVDAAFLEQLSMPLAATGYDPEQVDTYLDEVVAGNAAPVAETRFNTVRRGYDMQVVDAILDRIPGAHQARGSAEDDPAVDVDEVREGDVEEVPGAHVYEIPEGSVDESPEGNADLTPERSADESPGRDVDEVPDGDEIEAGAPAPARAEEA